MTWKIEDLYEIVTYSDPSYEKDGRGFIYLENRIDAVSDSYKSVLKRYEFDSGRVSVLLNTDSTIKSPIQDETGQLILYMGQDSGKFQVFSYELGTGKLKKLTDAAAGVNNFRLGRDGVTLFYTTTDSVPAAYEEVYVTEELGCFSDSRGLFREGEKPAIVKLDTQTGQEEKMTNYDPGYGMRTAFSLSPDDKLLAYADEAEGSSNDRDTNMNLLDLITGEKRGILPKEIRYAAEPVFSPDGRYLAFLGNYDGYHTSRLLYLMVYDLNDERIVKDTRGLDAQHGDFIVGDIQWNVSSPLVVWAKDSSAVYSLVSKDGAVDVLELVIDSEDEGRLLSGKDEHITCFEPGTVGEMLMVWDSPSCVSSVGLHDMRTGTGRTLLESKPEREYAEYRAFSATSQDGGQVYGYMVLPPKLPDGERCPLILNIHGGPYMMHGNCFHHEVQTMASSGYAVLLLNPRGSIGYGQHHQAGVVGQYGKMDYVDIMSGLDEALNRFEQIDPKRLYVTGGSYGGFMTNWITTQTDRFMAAVTQRSISNAISMWGASDIGYFFYSYEAEADILDSEKLWEVSPLKHVKNVATPTLVIHSENDYRCPIDQGLQWFTAIKYLGVKSRLVRFPRSNHELSRRGIPKFRIIRLSEMMGWFSRY